MDFGDEMGSKLADVLLRGAERLAFSLLSNNYRLADRRELCTATNREEGVSAPVYIERPEPAKLVREGASQSAGQGALAASGLECRIGPRRLDTADGEPQPVGKRGAALGGDGGYGAVAAVFSSPEDARGAVEALTSLGVVATVMKQAADGTCEVVVDISPSKVRTLGRELWEKVGVVRQRQFEADLQAVSPGARSASLDGLLDRATSLRLGGVA